MVEKKSLVERAATYAMVYVDGVVDVRAHEATTVVLVELDQTKDLVKR